MTIPTPPSPNALDDGAAAFAPTGGGAQLGFGQVAGAPAVFYIGAGATQWNGCAVLNVEAIKTSAGTETYSLQVQGSTDTTFAAPATLATVSVAATGQVVIPLYAFQNGVFYPYMRLAKLLTGAAPSIRVQAFALAFSAMSELSLAELIQINGIAAQNLTQVSASILAWATGLPTGGPNADGRYPLSDAAGDTFLVACPAMQYTAGNGLFSTIGSRSIPASLQSFSTSGYSTTGAGPAVLAATSSAGVTSYRAQSADGRWWQVAESAPWASHLGMKGNGTDEGAKFQAALNAYGAMRLDPGMVVSSSTQIVVPTGGQILGCGPTTGFKALGNLDQYTQLIEAGNNSVLRNFLVDGGNFNAGGVSATNKSNVLLEDVGAQNSTNDTVADASQLFQFHGSTNVRAARLYGSRGLHGIEMWQCNDIDIFEPRFWQIHQGGIWTADCSGVRVIGGVIRNCGDVGLDFEGGVDCVGLGVRIESCCNGELAFFRNNPSGNGNGSNNADTQHYPGCTRLRFIACQAHRTSTFMTTSGATANCTGGQGALFVASMSDNAQDIVVAENDIVVDWQSGWSFHAMNADTGIPTTQDIHIVRNRFKHNVATPMFVITGYGHGVHHEENQYFCNAVVTSPAVFKNASYGISRKNKYELSSTLVATSYAVQYYTDNTLNASIHETTIRIVQEEFTGWDGYSAAKVDPYTAGDNCFTMEECRLSDGFVGQINGYSGASGGGLLMTGNGRPHWINQRLKVLVATLSSSATTAAVDLGSALLPWNSAIYPDPGYLPMAELLIMMVMDADRNAYPAWFGRGQLSPVALINPATGAAAASGSASGVTSGGQSSFLSSVSPNSNGGNNNGMYSVANFAKPPGATMTILVTATLRDDR